MCYCRCFFLNVTPVGFFLFFCFPSDPCYIRQFPWYVRRSISLLTSPCGTTCVVQEWGGGGGGWHGWRGGIPGLACKFKLVHNLLCQTDSWYRVPVRFPFPQRTGESISVDHTWVQSCNQDCDYTVYPTPYVRNGFIHFSAMVILNWSSDTWFSLHSMPLIDRKNRENCFRWL